MTNNHFDYTTPFNSEILDLIPYKTNVKLTRKVDYLFRHVKFKHSQLYIEVSTLSKGSLTRDMANVAIALVRHYISHPQQYGHSLENIMFQILIRMWKQTFKHCILQHRVLDEYYATKMALLSIDNGLWEELIRTVEQKDYIQHNDDMVKPLRDRPSARKKKIMYDINWKECEPNIRARSNLGTQEGSSHFEYLASLE